MRNILKLFVILIKQKEDSIFQRPKKRIWLIHVRINYDVKVQNRAKKSTNIIIMYSHNLPLALFSVTGKKERE